MLNNSDSRVMDHLYAVTQLDEGEHRRERHQPEHNHPDSEHGRFLSPRYVKNNPTDPHDYHAPVLLPNHHTTPMSAVF
jgi:hypothetical protein